MLQYSLALLPALLIILLQKPDLAIMVYISLGQGHFILTYLYQYRGGKINLKYIAWYLVALPTALYLAINLPLIAILTISAITFSIHYLYDEARIMSGENKHLSFSLLFAPIVLFTSYLLYEQYNIDVFPESILAISILATYTWFRFGSKPFTEKYVLVTNIISAVLIILYALGGTFPSELILGGFIIHHYSTWYIFQYRKLRSNISLLSNYLVDVLFINVLIIVAYLLYLYLPEFDYLSYIYEPNFFYAWTVLHILFASQDLFSALTSRVTNLLQVK